MTDEVNKHSVSALWIDYKNDFPQLPEEILLAGENEWLKNASSTYGCDTEEVWASDVLPSLMAGTLSPTDEADLRLYTPKFLAELCALPVTQASEEILRKIQEILR